MMPMTADTKSNSDKGGDTEMDTLVEDKLVKQLELDEQLWQRALSRSLPELIQNGYKLLERGMVGRAEILARYCVDYQKRMARGEMNHVEPMECFGLDGCAGLACLISDMLYIHKKEEAEVEGAEEGTDVQGQEQEQEQRSMSMSRRKDGASNWLGVPQM
jgi:hypothetical protein